MAQNTHEPTDKPTEEQWIRAHSVTCALCGGLADERRSAELTSQLRDERPALLNENPLRAVAIATAVNEFGEGEAHEECLAALEEHLLRYGARLAEELEIDERNHR
jgi:hypothetical protein